ncbi:MAG: nucleotidyltransferase family protein [Chloroflexi bacterium]|nr:nucleotidyltransferase family protein [Chloroflexota bacterium]
MDGAHRLAALVLAGGLGTRLRPLTDDTPKCLLPVGEDVLLGRWLSALEQAGVDEVVVNTHHLADVVRPFLLRASSKGRMCVAESHEPDLLGSAGTLSANRSLADGKEAVVVLYADNVSDVDLRQMLSRHKEQILPVSMLLFHAVDPNACGIAVVDEVGRVVAFEEKPKHPTSDLANAGVYVFDADAYREAADLGGKDIGFDVLPNFVGRMYGIVHNGYHVDVGTPEALALVRLDAARGRINPPGGAR